MTYLETLDYLYASVPAFHQVGAKAYKPGLDNTIRLMEHVGNPHTRFRSIHVAGTNGKGSTSHLLAAVLQAAGYRVGLYTSPHLVDFRERIRINGEMIPQDRVVIFVAENKGILEAIHPSFFETTMALAFQYFAEEKVDIAIVEVGLGGRLDSTNIITPEVSVITNIGLDHTAFLGDTLSAIASEKAGIIKPYVPVVIGETHEETREVFEQQAESCHAPIYFADQYTSTYTDFEEKVQGMCQLQGMYQAHNKQTVFCTLQIMRAMGWHISDDAIEEGYAQVCTLTGVRGRWEQLANTPLTYCDTGHNSHGIKYVSEQLQRLQQERGGELHIVFGMVDDKDVDVVLALLPQQAHYYFTQAQTHRAIPATQLQKMAQSYQLVGDAYADVQHALEMAQKKASAHDIIFIGGSNYVVGEVLPLYSAIAL